MFKKIFDRPPGEPLLVFRKRRYRRAQRVEASVEPPPPPTVAEPEQVTPTPPPPTPKPAYALRVKEPSRFRKFFGWYAKGLLGGLGVIAFLLIVLFLFPSPRMNILVLGLDRRAAEKTFVSRTDTMILATVDPTHTYVGMLSIPRDLYITLPSGQEGRINTAHFFAEAESPGTGPEAAMQTVRSNFGVTVNRFVRLDFAGFVKIVDAMGGVTIDVPAAVSDNAYPTEDGGTQFISFEAGPQHMDGQRALIYARTRHSSSDFERAKRQQLVIQACFNRLLQPGAWVRLPLILAAINASIDTNLTPLDLLRLAPTLLRVGPAGLDRRVIEGNMVQPNTTPNGGAVQLPVWENINPVLKEMFGE